MRMKSWRLLRLKETLSNREDPSYILDWHLDTGILWLKDNKYDFRIASTDGKDHILTCDLKLDRVNLHVVNKFITEITLG